jgi:Ca2+-transporting ATPase
VLESVTSWQRRDGGVQALDAALRRTLRGQVEQMALQGYRTLAVAYKRATPADVLAWGVEGGGAGGAPGGLQSERESAAWAAAAERGALASDLVLLALVAIHDPLREEVPGAVDRCKRAGIRVMMVTGDNMATAKTIATGCHVYYPGGRCMEGPEFRRLSPSERRAVCEDLQVLARSSPQDKLLLVNTLKKLGETVAVTGDGTNDAPALRSAHVGLAMGIAGTEVAKEASDIIIMDDNFASIVLSVRWGRAIIENIRKFLTFQLTINLVALTITFIVACSHAGSTSKFPLTAVQLLWINLIMDSFAALALATEPPNDGLLRRRPEGRQGSLISNLMWKNIVGHAVFQTALLLWMTYSHNVVNGLDLGELGGRRHYTFIFNAFVWLQVFNLLNCRKVHDEVSILEDISESHMLEMVMFFIVAGQALIVQFGGDITQTTPLSPTQWLACIVIGFVSVPVGYLLKLLPITETLPARVAAPVSAAGHSATSSSSGDEDEDEDEDESKGSKGAAAAVAPTVPPSSRSPKSGSAARARRSTSPSRERGKTTRRRHR